MSRYISQLPEPIKALAEKRRNKGEILKILLDEKASKDNTICLNSYGNGIIDAITFIDKDTEYPQNKNCTCNSRTVDEGGNIVHFEECDREKDKLGELIEWLRTTDMVSITMEDILAKAKEIKNK
jgi:hypothetical protein